MLRQALRLSRRQFRKPFLEGLRDLPVIAAPPALQERRISGILNERVFEDVGFVRRGSFPVQNPRLNQLLELGAKPLLVKPRNRPQHFVGKLPADCRPQLGHRFRSLHAVEPGIERVLQRRGDAQCRQRGGEFVAAVPFHKHVAFEDGLGELFQEQRHAIGLGDDMFYRLLRQILVAGDPANDFSGVFPGKAEELNLGKIIPDRPWRSKLGTITQKDQELVSSGSGDQLVEHFKRGGIDPMEILQREEHRLACGSREDGSSKRFDGSLSLSLGGQDQRAILFVKGDGKERGDQRHRSGDIEPVLEGKSLDLQQLRSGGIPAFELEGNALQEIDHRMETAALVKRRAAQFGQPGVRIIARALLERQEQP